MDSSHILIVDDEPDVCEVIQDRLKASGYQTHYVLNGSDALEYTQKNKPDLILLDIMMPEMDGYEVSKRLLTPQGIPSVPIIMVTAKQSQSDKIKALTLGVDDYITKPYDSAELLARIESVLRRSKNHRTISELYKNNPLAPEDEKRLELLKEMEIQKTNKLEPSYNLLSQNGYGYPFAAKILEKEKGLEKFDLEILVERKCLEREFFDKELLCPFCKTYQINLRETCPICRSSQLKPIDMIHHYRCAYIGKEEEFKSGLRYLCPKCHKELKHIGMDYDRIGKSYFCLACSNLSSAPQMNAQCRSCKQNFSHDDAIHQSIDSYYLTHHAIEVIRRGEFFDQNLKTPHLDEETGLYYLSYFQSELSQELERCQLLKRPLSLLFIRIENLKTILSQKGETKSLKIMKEAGHLLKINLKPIDIPAYFDESSMIALSIETNQKEVKKLEMRLRSEIKKLQNEPLEIILKSVSFPEDGLTEEHLLKQLVEREVFSK